MKIYITTLIAFLATLPVAFAEITDTEALGFLKKNAPEIHAQVALLESKDPQDFRSAITEAKEAAEEHALLIAASDNDSAAAYLKMYQLDFAAIRTADAIVLSTDEKKRAQLTAELSDLIAASYDQWAIVEQARVKRMEAELTKMKAELAKALADKSGLVKRDVATLIEECSAYQQSKKK